MKKNSSPEIEMLLMAELISYPYHLGRVNLESLTSLIVSPHARKVLGVLVEMRKNDEEVTLVNVAYHLKDSDVTAILTKSTQNVTTDASIYQHIYYLKELYTVRFLDMLAMKMSQVSGDMSLSSSEKLNKLIDELNHEADMLSECRSLHHIGDVMNESRCHQNHNYLHLNFNNHADILWSKTDLLSLHPFLLGGGANPSET